MEQDYPVYEEIEVIDGTDIFKDNDWWKAVLTCEAWGSTDVYVYLWQNDDGDWKRKQKFKVSDTDEWENVKETVDTYVDEYLDE
jgi:hypothetical protein